MKKNILFLLYLLFGVFVVLFSYDYANSIVWGLVDDIAHANILQEYKDGLLSTKDLFNYYLSVPNRHQRPLSGFYIAAHTYLGQYNLFTFYFIKTIYVIVFLLFFRKFLLNETKNEYIIFFILFLSQVFPLTAATYFSVIMWQMYWVFTLYFIHLSLLYKNTWQAFLASGFMFLLCLLFNEYVGFFAPFALYLIFFRIPSSKKWLKFALAFILPLIIIFIYRYYFVDLIFTNKYKMDENVAVLSSKNIIQFIVITIKFFTVYTFELIKNSIINIKFYSVIDFILLTVVGAISYLLLKSKVFSESILVKKKDLLLAICLYLLIFSFCAVTYYKPFIGGYNSRIFTLGIFAYPILVVTTTFFIKNIKTRKIFAIAILLLSSISIISQKNAWISASELSDEIISHSTIKNLDLSQSKTIFFNFEGNKLKEARAKFVVDEPFMGFIPELIYHKYGIKGISAAPINFKESNREIFGISYDKSYPNFYFEEGNTIRIGNDHFQYPFYIYNYSGDQLTLIKDENQLKAFQKKIQNTK